MSYRRLLLVTALLAVATLLLPGRGGSEAIPTGENAHLRVGLVMDVGGRGDKSFNDAAFEGLERARRELGVTVELIEPAGSEDREAALRLFAARGFSFPEG